jgi:ribose/xylose/arabinose/galactoside ABC-type transport system permease subunit
VIGGVAITGGRGTAFGVALGCILLAILDRADIFLGVTEQHRQVLIGVVLLLAVIADRIGRGRSA